MRGDCSPDEGPDYRYPNSQAAQQTVLSVPNAVISKSPDCTQWSHNPENNQLGLFGSTPPINNIHPEVEVTGSNTPPKVQGEHISYNIRPCVDIFLGNVSYLNPCQEDEYC